MESIEDQQPTYQEIKDDLNDNSERFGMMNIRAKDISPRVIICGDPQRATIISTMMQDCVCVAENREYLTYTGWYKGKMVTVASHGVGGGGTSVAVEELIRAGARWIIRAGTCGSFLPEYGIGSLIVVTAAVRDDGVTKQLVPLQFPAVADSSLVRELQRASKQHNAKLKTGMCLTVGLYEPYGSPLGDKTTFWKNTGVCCVEMECSVLFVIASLRGVKAGCILDVDGYVFNNLPPTSDGFRAKKDVVDGPVFYSDEEFCIEDKGPGIRKMCKICLDAIVSVDDE